MLALSGCVFAGLAMADGISNSLDSSLDAAAESMTLTAGGSKGATQLYLDPNDGPPTRLSRSVTVRWQDR